MGALLNSNSPHNIQIDQIRIVVNADLGSFVLLIQVNQFDAPMSLDSVSQALQAGLATVSLRQQ
jgi:hypothetical protein